MENKCAVCGSPLSENFSYCPRCGARLNNSSGVPFSTRLGIYLLSVFLPPLGLFPGIKYLLQADQAKKRVGLTALILTAVSTIITVWISVGLISNINKEVNLQMMQYQNLGF
ncbi:MAG: zinc ribbon domain-containing protein [Patescibacteria group bacterium]|nr:zinc ribbon domain-containing protein [Patescibacteria group bacterium]